MPISLLDAGSFDLVIKAYIERQAAAFATGATWPKLFAAITDGIKTFVDAAAQFNGATGEEKKSMVTNAVGTLFDTLWPLLAGWSLWLIPLKPVVRMVVMYFAAEAIELAYEAFKAKQSEQLTVMRFTAGLPREIV